MNKLQLITKGILKENPTFVLILGMCPTLATTTSAINGMGMGAATMAVLIMSNIVISLIKNLIPDKVRIPAFIVVIASFVTVIQLLMQAYLPSLYQSLGIFIPLIVVNCIILGRAEAFASKNNALDSALDGLGIGLGFTLSLTPINATATISSPTHKTGILGRSSRGIFFSHISFLMLLLIPPILILSPGRLSLAVRLPDILSESSVKFIDFL